MPCTWKFAPQKPLFAKNDLKQRQNLAPREKSRVLTLTPNSHIGPKTNSKGVTQEACFVKGRFREPPSDVSTYCSYFSRFFRSILRDQPPGPVENTIFSDFWTILGNFEKGPFWRVSPSSFWPPKYKCAFSGLGPSFLRF